MKHSPDFLKIVNDAKSRIQEADFREVKQWIDNRQEITLVDVREESEWARGHLPGAVHLGKGIIERDIEGAFPDKQSRLVHTAWRWFSLDSPRGRQSAKNGLHQCNLYGRQLARLD